MSFPKPNNNSCDQARELSALVSGAQDARNSHPIDVNSIIG
jgi:hypothetical protein